MIEISLSQNKTMGEARKRKEAGLPPKTKKSEGSTNPLNLLSKYPRLPLYIGLLFGVSLIIDWIRLNLIGH